MLFIFSPPVLIRHLWQIKTVVFLHWLSNTRCYAAQYAFAHERNCCDACHEVSMEVDDNSALIFGNPQYILDWQLSPRPVHFLNLIVIVVLFNFIRSYIILLRTILSDCRNAHPQKNHFFAGIHIS
jgi:hypothetical protein